MNCQFCLTPIGGGKFCPSCGAAAPAASPPPAAEPAPSAWDSTDPRNVNLDQPPAFASEQQQPAWQQQQPMQQQPMQQQPWQPAASPARRPIWKRWWFWVLVVLGGLFLIGIFAPTDGGLTEQELVGRWNWDNDARWHYIFNEDGTGTRSTQTFGREQFNWSISGNTLRIESPNNNNLQFGRRVERWTMRYREGELRLSLEGSRYYYSRAVGGGGAIPAPTVPAQTEPAQVIAPVTAEQVVGTWNWEEVSTWQYFFAPNGQGTRGGGTAAVEDFEWQVAAGNVLRIRSVDGEPLQFGVANEEWSVQINGNLLVLTSLQAEGMSFTYERAE
ncbi:MAG: hypothetical protein FWB76_04835 [Oscillospiraceae bacterium]|nr:hypothetical protein [Oscillospiraceae bacterium]